MLQYDLRMFFQLGWRKNTKTIVTNFQLGTSKRHSHRQGVDVAVGAGGMAGMAM